MLTAFQKPDSRDKKKIVKYKTGLIKEQAGNTIPFKYYLLDREDIRREAYLKNIEMQSYQVMVRTTCDYKFTGNTKVIIDGLQYTVDSFYKEEQEISNGLFRKRVKPFVYLILRR